MGKTKDLFMQMAESFMQGVNVEREMRDRMADEEYQYTIYKKVRETQQSIKENSYGEGQ